MTRRSRALALCAIGATGCGGGVPLLHPAQVLRPGFVEVGAGVSGELALKPQAGDSAAVLEELAVAPGVAPWVGGRVGITGDNEGDLEFTGRTIRAGGRHAFTFGAIALSVGLGGSAIIAHQPGHDFDPSGVFGAGVDIPVLVGIHTRSDLYSLWIGPRVGIDYMRGVLGTSDVGDPNENVDNITATHWYVGGLAGMRVGFRHVHVSVEGSFSFNRVDGTFGGQQLSLEQLAITPAGALQIEF